MKEKWKESKYTNAEKINETQKQPERKRDKYYKADRKKIKWKYLLQKFHSKKRRSH